MPRILSRHVEVYLFRRKGRAVQFLALRRSPGRKLAGVWQPVTGKPNWGESAIAAAAREVLEETGLTPLRWWALEQATVYFNPDADVVEVLPLFAAEVAAKDRVQLSDEHDASRFVTLAAAGKLYLWEAQRAGLEAVRRQVLSGGRLAKALEIRPTAPARRRSKRA